MSKKVEMIPLFKGSDNSRGLVAYISKISFTDNDRQGEVDELFYKLKSELCKLLFSCDKCFYIETPCIMPLDKLNTEYQNSDMVFKIANKSNLCLAPETTKASYEVAEYLINKGEVKDSFCVWQERQSFRNEKNEQSIGKHLHLPCFIQREYQFFTQDDKDKTLTKQKEIADIVLFLVKDYLTINARVVTSDRLPNYSLKTLDIEIQTHPDKWLEICSISLRNDFTKKGKNGKPYLNIEIAFGVSRMLFCELYDDVDE